MAATLINFARETLAAVSGFDLDVLNMVTGNQPLETVLHALVEVVERAMPGIECSLEFRRRGKQAASTQPDNELLALAHSVGLVSGNSERVRRLMKVRSQGRKTIGDLILSHRAHRPVKPAQIEVMETALHLASIAIQYRELHFDLDRQAATDRATALPNRYAWENRLTRFVRNSKAAEPAAVIWIAFERLNDIQDSVGYRTKDALLRSIGRRVAGVLSAGEWLARAGGNEFGILCEGVRAEAALECAKRVLRSLESSFKVQGYEFHLPSRIGIALYPDHGLTAVSLQQNAANAAWRLTSDKRVKYALCQQDGVSRVREQLQTEVDLRRAIDNGELQLFYQPQVDLDGQLVGMEALIRWNHPKRGMIAPEKFIPLAETTGLIVPIGAWVIGEACRQGAEWSKILGSPVKVGVNVSALQLYFSDLPEIVAASLESSCLTPSSFEIELTESTVMRNADESAKALQKLRDLGVTIAIDDFGTGYSSLSYLQKLPVDLLKIDRFFLRHIDANTTAAVVRAITVLGHSLGLRVVAEGIETDQQMESVRHIGVDFVQGYLIGRPMPSDKALEWMQTSIRNAETTRQWRQIPLALDRTNSIGRSAWARIPVGSSSNAELASYRRGPLEA